jgi:fructoselysine transporter
MSANTSTTPKLERELSLTHATAINMIDMVGIGPFVTISIIVSMMQGPLSIMAWMLGAILSYVDGMVWAEMGAKWPEAGGSYVFLQKLYGGKKLGKAMPFLFIWQTTIQAPLVVASGAIGFAQYLTYLIPLDDLQKRMVSGGLVLVLVALLYRNIKSIGRISTVLGVITVGTILWIIFSGIGHFNASQAFDFGDISWLSAPFYVALGQASQKAVYSYLGYYNVCHLGAEIKNPQRNIPRAIFISITGIALLYLGMQTAIIGVLPWKDIAGSDFVISLYFEQIYNHTIAQIVTVLILCIALASLFSVILGYSRIPYAAAKSGDFFPVFAKLHPKHHFPYVSLLALGGLAFVFSLLFKMKEVITAIIVMRILIQFISQAVGVIAWHIHKPKDERPYKMPLFPIPAIISICIWLFLLLMSDFNYILFALSIIASGILLFFLKESMSKAKQ